MQVWPADRWSGRSVLLPSRKFPSVHLHRNCSCTSFHTTCGSINILTSHVLHHGMMSLLAIEAFRLPHHPLLPSLFSSPKFASNCLISATPITPIDFHNFHIHRYRLAWGARASCECYHHDDQKTRKELPFEINGRITGHYVHAALNAPPVYYTTVTNLSSY